MKFREAFNSFCYLSVIILESSYILDNHMDDVLVYFKKTAQMAQSP